jgi:iron complex transport system permease protein
MKRHRGFWSGLVLVGTLFGLCLFSVGMGPVDIPPGRVWELLMGGADSSPQAVILFSIRLPRVLLAVLVGAVLALSGAVMQGFFQNPMADPYVVGVSSGAGLGATLAFAFGLEFWFLGVHAVSFCAFAGGLAATFLVWGIASGRSHQVQPNRLLLTGVGVGAVATAFTSYFMLQSPSDMQRILFWLMGSLANRRWDHLAMVWPHALVGTLVLLYYARDMNLLLEGAESAGYLGVDVVQVRRVLLICAALLASAAVAVSGIIGFIGLIVPHLMRLVVGPDHRRLLPASMVGGALLLVGADILARTLMSPAEIPIGVITALVGGPFFLYLLNRRSDA